MRGSTGDGATANPFIPAVMVIDLATPPPPADALTATPTPSSCNSSLAARMSGAAKRLRRPRDPTAHPASGVNLGDRYPVRLRWALDGVEVTSADPPTAPGGALTWQPFRLSLDGVLNATLVPGSDEVSEDDPDTISIVHIDVATITTSLQSFAVSFTVPSRRQWTAAVKQLFDRLYSAAFPFGPRHFIALVAPTSGSGNGPAQWEVACNTLLRFTPHRVTTIGTTHRRHAEEYAAAAPLEDDAVLVAVGGDGMLHEVINGLAARADAFLSGPAPRVGHFPAGSGCAFAKNFGLTDQNVAAMTLVRCVTRRLDLVDCEVTPTRNADPPMRRKLFVAGLFSSMAAIDFDSEWLRPVLGGHRFLADSIRRMIAGRVFFHAEVSYRAARVTEVPPSVMIPAAIVAPEPQQPPTARRTLSFSGNAEALDIDAVASSPTVPDDDERLDGIAAIARHFTQLRPDGSRSPVTTAHYNADRHACRPAPCDAQGWSKIPHQHFCMLFMCKQPWVASDCLAASFARPDDGCMDLHYSTCESNRLNWIFGVDTVMNGNCAIDPRMRVVKCKEIIMDVLDGYSSLDGERCPLGRIHFRCGTDTLPLIVAPDSITRSYF